MTAVLQSEVDYATGQGSPQLSGWRTVVVYLFVVAALVVLLLFMERAPAPLISKQQLQDVNRIQIGLPGEPFAVLQAEVYPTLPERFSEGGAPQLQLALGEKLFQQLTEPLPSLQPTTISRDRAGLNPPRLTLEITSGSANYRYEFGRENLGLRSVYLRRSDSDRIYLVPSQLLATIERLYEELAGGTSSIDQEPHLQTIEMQ